jgi:hypothetical protein
MVAMRVAWFGGHVRELGEEKPRRSGAKVSKSPRGEPKRLAATRG